MNTDPYKNPRGNAMVGTLAAAVLGGVVLTTLFNGIGSAFRGQRMVSSVGEQAVLASQIQGLLSDPSVCKSILQDSAGGGVKFDPDVNSTNATPEQVVAANTLAQIKYGAGMELGAGKQFGSLHLTGLSLLEIAPNERQDTQVSSVPARRYRGLLTLSLNRAGAISSQLTFPLSISTNRQSTGPDFRKVVECSSQFGRNIASVVPDPHIIIPGREFRTNFTCNNLLDGSYWSIGFWFHGVEYGRGRNIVRVRYRDFFNRYIDFRPDGSFERSNSNSACNGKHIRELNQEVRPPA